MNNTDIDLILALAEGRLSGQAKQEALQHIAENPNLGTELASQISVMEELQSMPPAHMTAQERAELRSSLIEQLHITAAPVVVQTTKQRRPWWQPVLGLASAAVLVLAVVIVPGMFGDGNDRSSEIVAVERESASVDDGRDAADPQTTAAAEDDGLGGEVVSVPLVTESDVADFFVDIAGAVEPAGAQFEAEDGVTAPEESPTTLEDAAADNADELDEDAAALRLAPPAVEFDLSALDECLNSLADPLPEGDLTPHAATETDDGHIVHLGVETDSGIEYALSIEPTTCTVVPINP